MRKIFTRIAAVVTAAAVTLTAVVFDVPDKIIAEAATSEETSSAGGCDGSHTGMTAWTSTTALPTSGNYYLNADVNLSSQKKLTGDLTLCLNGHTITFTGSQSNDARIFNIDGGSLTLCDCQETGKLTGGNTYPGSSGGAVYIKGGTFNMYGGTISGNNAAGGGGVYAFFNGTFNMYGGKVSGNTANNGGGVSVFGGTFNMYGGTISGNGALSGGGVYVNSGNLTINGKVNISDNTNKSATTANNVYLGLDTTITIGDNFNTSSKIGVNTVTKPTCSSPVAVTGEANSDISSSFKSDNETYSVVYEESAVKLSSPHTLKKIDAKSATCSDTGNIVYWTCSECDKLFTDENGATETTVNAVTIAIDENAHVWDEWSVTKEPAVSSDGEITRTCRNNSSHTETAALSKLSDATVWTKTVTQQSTIDTSGTYTYTSDYGTVTVTVPQLTDTVWTKTETKQPTIDTSGTYTYASDYGTVTVTVPQLSDTTVWTKDNTQHVDATEESTGKDVYNSKYGTVTVTLDQLGHTHNWGNWTITKDPSFTTTGTAERTCTKDSEHKDTIELPVLSDTIWTKTETQQPTIDTSGTYTYTNTDYGTVTVTVPMLSDEEVWTKDTQSSTEPTLTDKGEYIYNSVYGEVTTEVPELSDETVWEKDTENSTDPSSTDKGEYVYNSEMYGEVTIKVPELSDETVWEKDTENSTDPSLTDKGEYVYNSVYGEVTTEVPELGDETVWEKDTENSTDPTLTDKGEYVYNSVYGEVTTEVPGLGDETVWEKDTENSTDPTLTDKGEYVYNSVYGEVTIEIPALGGTDEDGESVWTKNEEKSTEPTITEPGTYVYESEEYGEVTIEIPALGGTDENGESVWTKNEEKSTEPTITDPGTYVYESEEYGEIEIEVPALNDTDVWTLDESQHVDPTEDQPGKDVYTSEYGEVTVTIQPIEHTHTYSSEWTSDETNHWHAATCGHDEKIDEAAHTWNDGEITKQPTADETGEKTLTCTVCGKTKTEVIPATGGTENPDPENPHPDNPDPDNPDPDNPDPDNPDPDNPDPDNPDPDNPDPDNPDPDNPDPDNPDPDNPDPDNPDPDNPDPDNPDPDNPDPDNPDPDNPDNGSISKEVQPGENAPDTELGTPLDELIEAVLTPEEQELVNDGIEIKIVLTVEDGTDSAPAEDKEKVETVISELSDCKIGQYLDVTLLKIIGDDQEKVTETNAPITLIFAIPEALRGEERTYSVIRVHDGEADILSDLDSDMNTVTIKTDKFSTYALVYSERTSVTTPVGNFTVPEASGSGSSDTAPSESETTDDSGSAPTESKPADSGNNTLTENSGSSDNGTTLPNGEASSTDDNGTNSDSGNASAGNNNSMSDESADTDNNNDNPSTGIAVSLLPLASIIVLSIAVKRKRK